MTRATWARYKEWRPEEAEGRRWLREQVALALVAGVFLIGIAVWFWLAPGHGDEKPSQSSSSTAAVETHCRTTSPLTRTG